MGMFLLFGKADLLAQSIDINTTRAKETYQLGSTVLKQKEVKERISNDKAAWNKFVSGQRWNIGGIVTTGAGSIVLLSGVAYAIDYTVNYERLDASVKVDESLGWTLVGAGLGAMVPGAIMIIHGRNQRINAVKNYNQTLGASSYEPVIRLKPASRGIGLALVF
jgi:hypothetical protein